MPAEHNICTTIPLLYGAALLFLRILTYSSEPFLEIYSFHDLLIPTIEVPE